MMLYWWSMMCSLVAVSLADIATMTDKIIKVVTVPVLTVERSGNNCLFCLYFLVLMTVLTCSGTVSGPFLTGSESD
jgi:hypothetical protein